MAHRYILTLMAANRVGILSSVARALADLGGDLQEVSQTVMQKFFTIILAAEFPEDRRPEEIVEHIRDVCHPYGVEVSLKDPARETLQEDVGPGGEKYFLTITGQDEPGIIREITGQLSTQNIDVTDLYAVRNRHDRSFVLIMELSVPEGVDPVALQSDLESLGSRSGLSASMQHENIFLATNDPRPVRITLPRRLV